MGATEKRPERGERGQWEARGPGQPGFCGQGQGLSCFPEMNGVWGELYMGKVVTDSWGDGSHWRFLCTWGQGLISDPSGDEWRIDWKREVGTRSSDQMEKDGGRPREEAAGVGEVVGLYMYI